MLATTLLHYFNEAFLPSSAAAIGTCSGVGSSNAARSAVLYITPFSFDALHLGRLLPAREFSPVPVLCIGSACADTVEARMATSCTHAGPVPLLDRFRRVGSAVPVARHFVLLAVQLRGDHRLLALLRWVELAVHMAGCEHFLRKGHSLTPCYINMRAGAEFLLWEASTVSLSAS